MDRKALQALLEERMRESPELRRQMENPYFRGRMLTYLDRLAQPSSSWNLSPDDGAHDLDRVLFQMNLEILDELGGLAKD